MTNKNKLYDVHICTTNGLDITSPNVRIISYVTPHYNIPFLIARSKVRAIGKTKTTFAIALPNGTEVLKYFSNKNQVRFDRAQERIKQHSIYGKSHY